MIYRTNGVLTTINSEPGMGSSVCLKFRLDLDRKKVERPDTVTMDNFNVYAEECIRASLDFELGHIKRLINEYYDLNNNYRRVSDHFTLDVYGLNRFADNVLKASGLTYTERVVRMMDEHVEKMVKKIINKFAKDLKPDKLYVMSFDGYRYFNREVPDFLNNVPMHCNGIMFSYLCLANMHKSKDSGYIKYLMEQENQTLDEAKNTRDKALVELRGYQQDLYLWIQHMLKDVAGFFASTDPDNVNAKENRIKLLHRERKFAITDKAGPADDIMSNLMHDTGMSFGQAMFRGHRDLLMVFTELLIQCIRDFEFKESTT